MYLYHTPSGDKSCDGMAMALRLGLPLRDMEMVQFHPTGLLAGPETRMTGTVLEEGLRGAGGWLLNGAGERFMERYHAHGERATRDIVSRAIYAEMRAGNTTPHGGVYIEMKHLGPDMVARRFKGMVQRCADCGFDLAGGRVEVVPTAHYMMGGLEFEEDTSTALSGLFAAGEDCGGVHGANRLGGNGVANSTVFGGIAGAAMAAYAARDCACGLPDETAIDRAIERGEAPFTGVPGDLGDLGALRDKLWHTMWDDVGILRTAEGLSRALQALDEHDAELQAIGIADDDRRFNLTWHDWLNLESLVAVSKVIAVAALARDDSRGAHFREDFPETADLEQSKFSRVRLSDGDLRLEMVPVDFSIVRPGQSLIEEQAGAPPTAA
jgi:fumarate reductase flavoprotein subunit